MSDLTILCVSNFGEHVRPFIEDLASAARGLRATFVLAVDGPVHSQPRWATETAGALVHVTSQGYMESILDEAIAACPDGYILRIDDDERVSPTMARWLADGSYRAADHWAFPRLNLWPDETHYITNRPLWPDLQTRLSVKAKAGGRPIIHQGSPHGTGEVADVPIEHHKFLVRSREEREELLERYERVNPGAGSDYAPFSVPERYADSLVTRRVR